MNGRLEQKDNRWKLRFDLQLAHPPVKVWRAITEADHLAAWFPQRIVGEWVVGAPLRFESRGGEFAPFDGEVLAFDPESALEFVANSAGCALTLLDTIDDLGKAARDSAGWHVCLEALEHDLAGTDPPGSVRDRWSEVHASYVEKFGPEASIIGPPAGM